ncbi:Cyclic pyranopterin monophosphate synthase [Crateriforma conspicua]|uniref:GTP 3',8-cyclase n=1 Tax=Crateriforma conspicua TaxID=2527996 RepID=A0A5C5Y0Y4_9PLAN|nr:Cyclic pyranopterin monophosphate synthase [Crateriforma conspicua]
MVECGCEQFLMSERLNRGVLVDRFGRKHTSLRVSVTDRCNLRCTYCMPADTPDYCERDSILTFEEITRVVRIAAGLGVDDVRLTGGEPLVRSQLYKLVRAIGNVAGVKKVSLTTNAILLADQLSQLHAAGLRSVNISLDALDEASFFEVTRRPGMQRVLDAIDACRAMDVKVKVNAIAMKHFTERQIAAFGEFTRATDIPVRFIEFMPLDADGNWDDSRVLAGKRILDLFAQRVGVLSPKGEPSVSPAIDYTFEDGVGTIGIIASVTQPFCSTCNRFRLTADGQLRNCLFGGDSGDLRALLRDGSSDEAIADRIVSAVMAKKRGHGTDDLSFDRPSRPMYSIGG